jgi:hypothetical protein
MKSDALLNLWRKAVFQYTDLLNYCLISFLYFFLPIVGWGQPCNSNFTVSPTSVCVGENTLLQSNPQVGVVFTWDCGGCFQGNPGNSVGPHSASWTTPGTKTVTLNAQLPPGSIPLPGSGACPTTGNNLFYNVTVSGCSGPLTPAQAAGIQINIQGDYDVPLWAYDMQFYLIAPNNTTIRLYGGYTSSNCPTFDVTFSSSGVTLPDVNGNPSPCSGTFLPQGGDRHNCDAPDLPAATYPIPGNTFASVFTGVNPNGVWKLFATDRIIGGIFTLNCFTLTIPGCGTFNGDVCGCTAPTTTQLVVVNPAPPTNFTAAPAAVCTNSNVTLTYQSPPILGATFSWNCNGCLPNLGNTPNPPPISWATPGTYSVTLNVIGPPPTSCQGPSTIQVVTVNNPPQPDFSITNNVICEGQVTTLQLTAPAFVNGDVFSWNCNDCLPAIPANSNGPHAVSWASAGTKTITLQYTRSGCSPVAISKTVVVNPTPSSTFSIPPLVCSTLNTNLNYTGTAGVAAYTWNCDGCVPLPAGQGPHTISWTVASVQTRTITLQVVSSQNCVSPITTALVTVNPLPDPPLANNIAACGSGVITFTLTPGAVPANVFRLYTTPSGGVPLSFTSSTNNPITISTPNLTVTTSQVINQFYLEAFNSQTNCVSATRTLVTTTQNPLPSPPSASIAPRCSSGTVTVTAQWGAPIAGDNFHLYTTPSGGIPLVSGSDFSFTIPGVVSQTTTFYLEAERVTPQPACTSQRVAVVAEIVPLPAPPLAASPSICQFGALTITAQMGVPPGNVVLLYSQPAGGLALATDNSAPYLLKTPEISATTTFYLESQVTQSGLTCSSSVRSEVAAIVHPNPLPPSASAVERCGPGSARITAVLNPGSPNNGDQARLYRELAGGAFVAVSSINEGLELLTPSVSTNTTFYIETRNSQTGCVSARSPVEVIINPLPGAPQVQPFSRCGAGLVTFTASFTGFGGVELRLYTQPSGGSPISTSAVSPAELSGGVIQTTTTFYIASVNEKGCEVRVAAVARVHPLPGPIISRDEARCGSGAITFLAIFGSPLGDAIELYDSPVGGQALSTDYNAPYELTTPPLEVLGSTVVKSFYLQSINRVTGCAGPRVEVKGVAHLLPGVVISSPVSRCGAGSVEFTAVHSAGSSGSKMRLYDSPQGVRLYGRRGVWGRMF